MEPTISQLLRMAGYGHRKDPHNRPQDRTIFELATGRVVGEYDAGGAVEFLRKLGTP